MITDKSKEMIDFFAGAEGDEYTKRNLNSVDLNKSANNIIYNIVKIKKFDSVCEVGCNIGNNLSRLKGLCLSYGVDINENAIKKGLEKYPFIKFVKGSIYEIPLQDNSFDLVFTRGVLIHIPPEDRKQALKELKRISKKYIVNIEYPVEDEKNKFEEVEWRNNKLWRFNASKYWKEIEGIKIKDYFEVQEDMDTEKNWICVVEKQNV